MTLQINKLESDDPIGRKVDPGFYVKADSMYNCT